MAYLGGCKWKIADRIIETIQRSTPLGSVVAIVQFLDYAKISSKLPPAYQQWNKRFAKFLRVMFTELAVDQVAIRPSHHHLGNC